MPEIPIKTGRTPDNWLLPTQMTTLLLSMLSEKGVKLETILAGLNLSESDLQNESYWISYRQTLAIIDRAYQYSGDPALGLTIGCEEDLSTFGILGYAMLSCETLGDAIEVGGKYHRAAQSLLELTLVSNGDRVEIHVVPPFLLTPQQYRFSVEELFSGMLNMTRALVGHAVFPVSMKCAYSQPSYHERYERLFRCPISFDSETTSLVFQSSVVELPVLQANKFNASMSEKLCQSILAEHVSDEGMVGRIRQLLVRRPNHFPSESELAAEVGMSSRNMRRKLASEGSSLRLIVEEVRFDLAKSYLLNTCMTIEKIAQVLGYTETTSFRRAFKRWAEMPPKQYRELTR